MMTTKHCYGNIPFSSPLDLLQRVGRAAIICCLFVAIPLVVELLAASFNIWECALGFAIRVKRRSTMT